MKTSWGILLFAFILSLGLHAQAQEFCEDIFPTPAGLVDGNAAKNAAKDKYHPVLVQRPGDKLPSVEMNPWFIGETNPDFHPEWPRGYVTKYLTPAEAAKYKITFRDGKVYKADGTMWTDPGHVLNYVLDPQGNFYAFDQVGHKEIRHSSIRAGGTVSSAGEMIISGDGRLLKIDNDSGHYAPPAESVQLVKKELEDQGVDTSKVTFVVGAFPKEDLPKALEKMTSVWEKLNLVGNPKPGFVPADVNTQNWVQQNVSATHFEDFDSSVQTQLQSLKTDILNQVSLLQIQSEVSYVQWLKLCERTSILLSARVLKDNAAQIQNSAQRMQDYLDEVREYSQDPNHSRIEAAAIAAAPKVLMFPQTTRSGLQRFNSNRAALIHPLQMTNELAWIDGILRLPLENFRHDLEHVSGLILTAEAHPISADLKTWYSQRLALTNRYEAFLNIQPSTDQVLASILWFHLFHEAEADYSNSGLLRVLSDDTLPGLSAYIWRRIQDPHDYALGNVDASWSQQKIEQLLRSMRTIARP